MTRNAGSVPLRVNPGVIVGASYLLPDNPNGRTIVAFDLGEGSVRIAGGTPEQTAAWFDQIATSIRTAAATGADIHPITKAA
ncbi:hypothetical protein [Patulibacter minatonensis]|uniref:hypothetical protein n=1 Tax=Patulibacter minatonensis TaxID=298163 RepID=UPI00047DB6F4|nr:hypothetical protein [Patulibacter minatonensis]